MDVILYIIGLLFCFAAGWTFADIVSFNKYGRVWPSILLPIGLFIVGEIFVFLSL